MNKDTLGLKGEKAAERYLSKRGYKIIDRRWRCRLGELDLVANKGDEVVFIEVKTRRGTSYGGAIGAVGWTKVQRLIRAAYSYLDQKDLLGQPFRIDVIAVTITAPGRAKLEHLKNAVADFD